MSQSSSIILSKGFDDLILLIDDLIHEQVDISRYKVDISRYSKNIFRFLDFYTYIPYNTINIKFKNKERGVNLWLKVEQKTKFYLLCGLIKI